MTWPSNQPTDLERIFVIEFVDARDAVVRLLGLFVAQGGRLRHLRLDAFEDIARLRVQADGLDDRRADHLRLRLQALPMVRGVSLGWKDLIPENTVREPI